MGWSVSDVMPGSDGPENLKVLKNNQLVADFGHVKQTVESLPLGHRELHSLPWSRELEG